ncbi:MAG TPA: hypothetical protein VF578_07305 [Methylomirabilota bacterium]
MRTLALALPETMLEQTRASIRANYAMVAASRSRIAASRRRLNPAFAITGGGESDDLRAIVRARLATGALFPLQSTRAWASYGEDNPCAVCRESITRAQVEYEVSSAVLDTTVRTHLRCYMLWKEESQSPPRPRRRPIDADDDGRTPRLA